MAWSSFFEQAENSGTWAKSAVWSSRRAMGRNHATHRARAAGDAGGPVPCVWWSASPVRYPVKRGDTAAGSTVIVVTRR
jgi:hypothetical protein